MRQRHTTHTPHSPTQIRTRVNHRPPPHPPSTNNSKCVKVTDVVQKGRERKSLAWWVTSRLYYTLRGTIVITPLTESSARSGPPIFSPSHSSALRSLSSQMLHTGCQHIFRDILEHPETGSVYRHLNTCPPTHICAARLAVE